MIRNLVIFSIFERFGQLFSYGKLQPKQATITKQRGNENCVNSTFTSDVVLI